MNFSRPIYWRQGIFLQPQHLQYSDGRQAASLRRLLKFSRPQFYGVNSCEVNTERLSTGVIGVNRFEALMPDGTWVHIHENARLPDLNIRQLCARDGLYHLSVKLLGMTPGIPAVAQPGQPGRFEPGEAGETMPDLYGDTPDLEVERLWYQLQFVVNASPEETRDGVLLLVAKLIVDGGNVRLVDSYFPAVLHIGASPALKLRVQRFVDTLQARAEQLQEMFSSWPVEGSEVDPLWLRDRLVHAEVSQALAQLQHRAASSQHACDVFEVLLVLLTRLSTLTSTSTLKSLVWDHDDPLGVFDRTRDELELLLEALKSGPDSVAVFRPKQSTFEANIPSIARTDKCRIYLLAQRASDALADEAAAPKLAPPSRIETVVTRALAGVQLETVARTPYGVSCTRHDTIWRINATDTLWREALDSGVISLSWLGLPKSTRLLLVFFRA